MFESVAQALSFIRERHIVTVDLKFANLLGAWHHVSLPASVVGERSFTQGLSVGPGRIPGLPRVGPASFYLVPDLSTGFVDPFWEQPALSFLCTVARGESQAAHPLDPRGIATRAEASLEEAGFTARIASSFEFYLFANVRHSNRGHQAYYAIDNAESEGELPEQAPMANGYAIPPSEGYGAAPPLDRFRDVRSEIAAELGKMSIGVRLHMHGAGAAGQQRFELDESPLRRAADQALLLKYVVRNLSARHGLVATFMPKPIYGEAGSGVSVSQALYAAEEPVFPADEGLFRRSAPALGYAAGQLAHLPSLLALTNPSTNSYKRLGCCWGGMFTRCCAAEAPRAALTFPPRATDGRIELRIPDGSCNPYLAFAASALAGLSGLLEGLRLEPQGSEARLAPEPADSALPSALTEALTALRGDHQYLLRGGAFPKDFVETYDALKRKTDIAPMLGRPHPYEISAYLHC